MSDPDATVESVPLPVDRDIFFRTLLRELSGTLQEVVGLEAASGYISVVGTAVGEHLDQGYRTALGVPRLSHDQVARVLVDLKRRIGGDFHIVEQTGDRIVLGNRACPFGEYVAGRPSLCMLTSNVFGSIAAENLGYSAVEVTHAIARGDAGCRVVVHLRPPATPSIETREYFRRDHRALADA